MSSVKSKLDKKVFLRGALPSPRHRLASAVPYKDTGATLTQVAYVPKQLSAWGNDKYGNCVSAEEAFAKACYNPEIFIPDFVVIDWAEKGGFLNGAYITEVMDVMLNNGFPGTPPTIYNDGPYSAVNYSRESILKNALSQGPVKIGIDADALPSSAGKQQGWVGVGGSPGQYRNEDHCVSLAGFGTAQWLFQQLGVPLPSTLPTSKAGYLLFTWSTIGFVDHAWLMSTCGEAWIRNPTTVIPVPPTVSYGTITLTKNAGAGRAFTLPGGYGKANITALMEPGTYNLVSGVTQSQ